MSKKFWSNAGIVAAIIVAIPTVVSINRTALKVVDLPEKLDRIELMLIDNSAVHAQLSNRVAKVEHRVDRVENALHLPRHGSAIDDVIDEAIAKP